MKNFEALLARSKLLQYNTEGASPGALKVLLLLPSPVMCAAAANRGMAARREAAAEPPCPFYGAPAAP